MQTWEIVLISVFACVILGLFIACVVIFVGIAREKKPREKKSLREWWAAHKPSKRRLIQVYAALLTNANIKGFATGRIYKGYTKYACVPGLNCYSCPGAVGACPLGSLQNALASSDTRAPYYVFGILILFGVLLGRTICGFLCPFGLFQDLLYKIKTPKLKKSRVTRILSYLKYVLLAVFVISIPIMFGLDATAVPAFCKYICPAGTLGGAVGLLIHPDNADLYGMLGGLFTWKFLVLICVVVACVFIYRFFCRFLCPLGALYGLFNRIALLGVKLDKNKCTDCGLCLSHCKMDIKRVGDHECINCGECIGVCPAKAITWKGSKFFLHLNAVEPEAPSEERPLAALLPAANEPTAETAPEAVQTPVSVTETVAEVVPETKPEKPVKPVKQRKKRPVTFWLQVGAWAAALALLAGALVYYNFLAESSLSFSELAGTHYFLAVTTRDGSADTVTFTVEKGASSETDVSRTSTRVDGAPLMVGEGTEDDPYLLEEFAGSYAVDVAQGETVYFVYQPSATTVYTVKPTSANLSLQLFYYNTALTNFSEPATIPLLNIADGSTAARTVTLGDIAAYGNQSGDICYDFTLESYFGREPFSLSAHRGEVVIINFWYTECGPCKEEMPSIAEIADRFKDDVSVVAIHSSCIYEDPATMDGVQRWLDEREDNGRKWSDYNITFAQDVGSSRNLSESRMFASLGGKDAYPITVVVDRTGKIAFTVQGKIDEAYFVAQLNALIKM